MPALRHVAAGPPDAAAPDAAATKKAAGQIEAFFLRQLLAEVHTGEGGSGGGGFSGGMFHDMFNEALADQMSAAGGVGLGPMLEQQLAKSSARTPHAAPAPAALPGATPAASAIGGRSPAFAAHPALAVSALRAHAAYARGAAVPAPTAEAAPSPAPLGVPPLVGPLGAEAHISSAFGARRDPIEGDARHHLGLDLAAPAGTPVHAAAPGTVLRAGAASGYGNLVVVDHGGGVQTRYGHLSRIDVKAGEHLDPGATVGAVGHSGRATGDHLHFEVRKDGSPVDPEKALAPLKGAE